MNPKILQLRTCPCFITGELTNWESKCFPFITSKMVADNLSLCYPASI